MEGLHATIPMPHLVVIVEAHLGTIKRRLSRRPIAISRIAGSISDNPAVIMEASELLDEVRKVVTCLAGRHKGTRMIVIDNDPDDALESNAHRITDAIQEY